MHHESASHRPSLNNRFLDCAHELLEQLYRFKVLVFHNSTHVVGLWYRSEKTDTACCTYVEWLWLRTLVCRNIIVRVFRVN